MKQTSLSVWVFTLMNPLLRPANRVMVLITPKTQRDAQTELTNWKHGKGLWAKKTTHKVAFSLLSDLSHLNLNLGHEVLGTTSPRRIFFAGGIAEWSGSSVQADMLDSLEIYVVKSSDGRRVKLSDSLRSCPTRHPAVSPVRAEAMNRE